MTRHLVLTAVSAAALAASLAGCAATVRPGAVAQAQQIHDSLTAAGADRRVEGDLIRARQAIAAADSSVGRNDSQEVADGYGRIALRRAQTAQARDAALRAAAEADSLRTRRLSTQLAQTEAQRQQAAALAASEGARADSLRQVAEETSRRLNEALTNIRNLVTEITNLQETTRGLVISLSDVLFDVNRATLRSGAEQNVRRIAEILRQYPDNQISVEGHTDATGSDAYNRKLSEDRAASVRAALVAGGVDASRVTSRGFGKAQPVATNATAEGRQRNRRVEVVVLGAGSLADAARARAGGQPAPAGAPGATTPPPAPPTPAPAALPPAGTTPPTGTPPTTPPPAGTAPPR